MATVNTSLAGAMLALAITFAPAAVSASSVTLRGSHGSMERQHAVARENDFTFLRTAGQVRTFVEKGILVPLDGTGGYSVEGASFPDVRPEVRSFVQRLAPAYRAGCGEGLVVTSGTRPVARQPRNASKLSVHPAGMAVDLRVSESAKCRQWLEGALLSLERQGLLDVTREHHPSHYHVAVFPRAYGKYVERLTADSLREAARSGEAAVRHTAASGRAATAATLPASGADRGRLPWLLSALGLAGAAVAAALARRKAAAGVPSARR